MTPLLYAIAIVVILAVVGIGPAVEWARARGEPDEVVIAPVAGAAAVMMALVTLVYFVPLGVAGPVTIVVMAIGSAAWAWFRGRDLRPDPKVVAIPAGFLFVGLVVGVWPVLGADAASPATLRIFDVWSWMPAATFMGENSLGLDAFGRDPSIPLAGPTPEVIADNTGASVSFVDRVGVSALAAGLVGLLGTTTIAGYTSVLAVVFGMLAPAFWLLGRSVGVRGALPSAVLCGFALATGPLVLTFDGQQANLAGLLLGSVLLAAIPLAATSFSAMPLAVVCLGALLSVQPEYLLPLAMVLAVVAIVAIWTTALESADARSRLPKLTLNSAGHLAALAAITTFLSPGPIDRANQWLGGLVASDETGGPLTDYTPSRAVAVLTGTDGAPPLTEAAYVGIAGWIIVGIAFLGALRSPRAAAVVIAGLLVTALVANTGYQRFQTCDYCAYKATTFGFPLIAAGVALAVAWIIAKAPRGRYLAGGLVVLVGVALGVSAERVVAATVSDESPERGLVLSTDAYDVTATAGEEGSGRILLESLHAGSTGGAYPYLGIFELSRIEGLAPVTIRDQGLWQPNSAIEDVRDYNLVISPFTGLETGRRTISEHGRYLLQERAPIDAALGVEPPAFTNGEPEVIPRIARPVPISINGMPAAGTYRLLVGVADSEAALAVEGGGPLQPLSGVEPGLRCANLTLPEGATSVTLIPALQRLPDDVLENPRSEAHVPITRIEVQEGVCEQPAAAVPGAVLAGDAWLDYEAPPDGSAARWSSGPATVLVGSRGIDRPAADVELRMASFAIPRTATATLGGETIARVEVTEDRRSTLEFAVPAGRGVAEVTIDSDPPAGPAAEYVPGDPRVLGLTVGEPTVTVSESPAP